MSNNSPRDQLASSHSSSRKSPVGGRSPPRDKPDTPIKNRAGDRDQEIPTNDEEREASDNGRSRPRLLDIAILVGVGYAVRDWFGPISEKIGPWANGSSKGGQDGTGSVVDRAKGMTHEAGDHVQKSGQKMANQAEEVTADAGDRIKKTSEELGDQIEETADDASDQIKKTSEELGDQIEEGSKQVGETLEEGGEGLSEMLEEGSEEASEKLEEGGEEASEKLEEGGEEVNEALGDGGEDSEEADEETKIGDGGTELPKMSKGQKIAERFRQTLKR